LYPDLSHIAAERLHSTAQQRYLQQEDDVEDEPDDVSPAWRELAMTATMVGRLLVFNVETACPTPQYTPTNSGVMLISETFRKSV